jgi:hypothetical protein
MNSDILSNIGNVLVEQIKSVMSDKRIDNTKKTSGSIHKQSSENNLKILGYSPPIEQLEKGRPPGKFAPVEPIREWVRTKLGISDEKEIKSVGFLVNRKIAFEGTNIYIDNSKGLELKNVQQNGIDLIKSQIGEEIRINLKSEINNKLKGLLK